MEKHVRNYRRHYQIGEQDITFCEACGAIGTEIHHIVFRSHGGSDNISNLICLCNTCHKKAHKLIKPYLSAEQLLQAKQAKELLRTLDKKNFFINYINNDKYNNRTV